jgi:HSP20 family molecular chaperone IbpA
MPTSTNPFVSDALSHLAELREPIRMIGQLLNNPHLFGSRSSSHMSGNFAPDFDLRETNDAYYLEGEFPGIANKDAINIHWVDGRTLVIDADITKVDLSTEWGVKISNKSRETLVDDGEPDREAPAKNSASEEHHHHHDYHRYEDEDSPKERRRDESKLAHTRHWLRERRCGRYHRSFTFPHEVVMDGVKARLNNGLLKLRIPKADPNELLHKEISIEEY